MKETIIFSYTNQFALLRLLAQYGVNTVGYRVFDNNSILSFIREKTGNLSSKKMINNKEKAYLYNSFLENDQSYFKGGTFGNAKNLSETIDSIRMLIVDNEEKEMNDKLQGNNKYEAINKLYKTYIDYLNKNNRTDAINEARELIDSNIKIDLEVIAIKGEELSPLNKKLLESVFISVKEIEYRELFNINKKDKISFEHLYKSNGYTHEVANVFKIISNNKLSFDKCTIVYTNYNNFYNPIKEYSNLLSIPVTYIDGVPATEFNAYRMLYLIIKLNDGLYGYDVLMNLIKDKSFNYDKLIQDVGVKDDIDLFLKEIGDLKFSFDSAYNDLVYSNYINTNNSHNDEIKKFKDIFNKGIINLIKEYVNNDDLSLTDKLIKSLELYKQINNKDDYDFFKDLLYITVNGSIAKEGTISVCSINKAKENYRENMFFIGNDSDSFHISLAENSYISDEKLTEFNNDSAKTSLKNAKEKRDQYKEVLQFAFDLGLNVYASYTSKDETELKKHNVISILYDLQKTSKPNLSFEDFNKNSFEPINSYYGNSFSKEEQIIEKYLDRTNKLIEEKVEAETEQPIEGLTDKHYSPTRIESNLKCKKRFLIEHILKINTEDEYDVFRKLDATDLGNMFHETMKFVNEGNKKSEKEVVEKAEEIFESVRAKRNPVLNYELEKDKKEFIKIVKRGFEYLSNKPKGVAEESDSKDLNINGNILHVVGTPDLVAGNEIIDYKAKRTVTHKDEDSLSCIQALIYALMNHDKNIDHVEYYYPFFKKVIKTTNNENNTIALLDEFYRSIANSDFPAAIEEDDKKDDKDKLDEICKYCNFSDICGKDK